MTKIEYSDQLESITNKNLIWIDIQKPTRNKLRMLEGKYPFHELNIEDCLSKIQIPKIDKYQDHIFIILLIIAIIPSLVMVLYFKKLGWFGW